MWNRCMWTAWVAVTLSSGSFPCKAQPFDVYQIQADGQSAAKGEAHPAGLTLTLGAPRTLPGWSVCVEYVSGLEVSASDSRVVADCELWRGDQLLGTGRISGQVEMEESYYYGYYGVDYAHLCVCERPFEDLAKGDVLQCNLRFQGFPVIPARFSPVSAAIALAASESRGCPEWF